MKKRAAEAALVLVLLLALFLLINAAAGLITQNTVRIDGEYYDISERELTLTLMTEQGLDELSKFTRLESLKITPYKAAVINSLRTGDEQTDRLVEQEAESAYADCTDVEDISFLSGISTLKRLDISYCGVYDISCIGELISLEALNIAYTNAEDISALAELDGVSELVITGIPAKDYSPLFEMDSLSLVKISGSAGEDTIHRLWKSGVTVEVYN